MQICCYCYWSLYILYIHPLFRIWRVWWVCAVCDLVSILISYLRIDQKWLACLSLLQIRGVLTSNDKNIRNPEIKYHPFLNITLVKTLECRDTDAMRSRRSLRKHIKFIQTHSNSGCRILASSNAKMIKEGWENCKKKKQLRCLLRAQPPNHCL